jgi:hypothetical protein
MIQSSYIGIIHILEKNSYEPSRVPDGFELKVLGGEGIHATVIYVFSEQS